MTSALALAASVRSGERSAREVTEEALAAVAAGDGPLHCFLSVLGEEARARADVVDTMVAEGRDPGPLAGVPVALKDNLCTRGTTTTCGSHILEGWRPPYDATVVAALADAGAVVLGKTNLDEFAMGSLDGKLRLRAHPQSVGHRPRARRVAAVARPPPWRPASCPCASVRTPAAPSASPPRSAASWA